MFKLMGEAGLDRRRDMWRIKYSLKRGFRGIMMFDGFRADSFFGDELNGRREEVMEESPLVSIEVVEERDDSGVI